MNSKEGVITVIPLIISFIVLVIFAVIWSVCAESLGFVSIIGMIIIIIGVIMIMMPKERDFIKLIILFGFGVFLIVVDYKNYFGF